MLQITPHIKIYIATQSIDFRCGIDSLSGFIKNSFNLDSMSGALFAFTNRNKSGIKFLIYDGQGFWLCYKRLSSGRLYWWPSSENEVVELDYRNMLLLIYNGDNENVKFQEIWKKIA